MTKLSTQPYKGARDFYPEDMQYQNYIFDTWKSVCRRFGYEQYDFPILEPFEIFAAKTGEEIVNNQLFSFEDKAGRKLAIRPEITPGTVRMIAQKIKELPKPIRWFMIGNNWRFEKPQLGRGREFNQLEVNVFGEESVAADFEIFQLIIAIMQEFGATENQFEILVSDRRIINALLTDTLKLDEDKTLKARRLMDRRAKMSSAEFTDAANDIGLKQKQIELIEQFMTSNLEALENVIDAKILESNQGYKNITQLFYFLRDLGLDKYCRFDPSIIRGFDYSDGLVYEVFDKNPNNRRSMFGGERFDKLINIFVDADLPATGFAMGDVTLLEFLRNWQLLPQIKTPAEFFITVWPTESEKNTKYLSASLNLAARIRQKGKSVSTWLDINTKLDKQLKYADKKGFRTALILGDSEIDQSSITIKNMKTGKQEVMKLEEFLS